MYYTYFLSVITNYLTQHNYIYSLLGHPSKPYYDSCIFHINEIYSVEIRTDPNTTHSCFAETIFVSRTSETMVSSHIEVHYTPLELFQYLEKCVSSIEAEE